MVTDNRIPAVDKTIRLLECLALSESGLSQSDLSRRLDIPGATCYRIIQSLLKHGWIEKNGSLFDLSQGLLPVARKVSRSQEWQELIKPQLDLLAATTQLSIKMSIRQGKNEYVTALRVESPQPMAVTGRQGAAFPMIEGSVGGALLCRASDGELKKLLKAAPEGLLEKNEPELLYSRIAECREKGYCKSNGRNRWGIEVISAPLFFNGEPIAAISVLGLEEHFKNAAGLETALLQTKKECEQILAESKA